MTNLQEEPFFEKIRKVNKDVWLLLFIVLPFFGFIILGVTTSQTKNKGESCYDQVTQEILRREGSKAMNRSDMDRYYSELKN